LFPLLQSVILRTVTLLVSRQAELYFVHIASPFTLYVKANTFLRSVAFLTEAFRNGCSVVVLFPNSAFVGVSATDGIRFPFPL